MIFLPLSAQNPNFLSFLDRFACTCFDPKRLKPLSVNAFRVNHQALGNQSVRQRRLATVQSTIQFLDLLHKKPTTG
ncbi:hypothetical protein BJP34_20060 [Moorena producens PAL-8-15-08-1]|uniref:Uncharacterized protein n=1 Tax=Moorena producens PAL-8-15-08-1 TaxID=1458985 RepID=A0A1D8TUV4_9CYAN|nr:hypothetical protein BJP34_20060 [Moorena producens PAL-8-15-08-1]